MPDLDAPRYLHRRSQYLYTDDPSKAMFREPEAISVEAQEQITDRSHRDADALLLAEWLKTRQRLLGAVAHFTQTTRPTAGLRRDLRSDLHVIERTVERVDRRLGVGS